MERGEERRGLARDVGLELVGRVLEAALEEHVERGVRRGLADELVAEGGQQVVARIPRRRAERVEQLQRPEVGPVALADYVGLDTCLAIVTGWKAAYPDDPAFFVPESLKAKVAEGKLGRKTGEGFFKWDGDKLAA